MRISAVLLLRSIGVAISIGVAVEAEKQGRSGLRGQVAQFGVARIRLRQIDIPPRDIGQGMLMPRRRVVDKGRRRERIEQAIGIDLMREVARHHVLYRFGAPGRDHIRIDLRVGIIRAAFGEDRHAAVDGVLIEELIDAVTVVFEHDGEMIAQIDALHLIERERDGRRRERKRIAGEDVLQLARRELLPRRIRDDGRGVVAEIDVEDQAGDFARVFGAGIADRVVEGEIGGVAGIDGPGRAPVLAGGEAFRFGQRVFFRFGVRGRLRAAIGVTVGVGLGEARLRDGIGNIMQTLRHQCALLIDGVPYAINRCSQRLKICI